ncbi:fructosamine kinase [Marinobacterium nitratireducens]|uniref:Fructosamine kinase n=1 Tax=Marinobacterium nitratireducens TaxID=518897 RepID=A0A918DXF3_9GAMM|nr:fructosamine kinase family protein [Marinobacterium nitratireducens]GGO86848.1 fructosamine kinase [Marinobacterium nitratireducens]
MPDSVPQPISEWLRRERRPPVARIARLGGGSFAEVARLELHDGSRLLLKRYRASEAEKVASEARGLLDLGHCSGLRVPTVLYQYGDCLLLEYIDSAGAADDFWQRLGEGLAQLHAQGKPAFGYGIDTFCGGTRQPNAQLADGYRFFAERRLLHGAALCFDSGLLSLRDVQAIESVAAGLERWLPAQAPALLHGDLWSGNVLAGPGGEPVLIDPAVYWGWPEADLAMTRLFGGFGDAFYDAYRGRRPLEPGWEERAPLYNLWHLLNHLYLFGASYKAAIRDLCRRYSG